MKLDANPEFSGQKAEVRVASFLKKPDSLLKEEGIDSSLVDGFLRRVEVAPQQKSRLVNVSFTSFSPELSARVTDAIAKSFIDLNIESKFEATQQAREWLEKQLQAIFAEVLRMLAPRISQVVMNTAYRMFPESKAAMKQQGAPEAPAAGAPTPDQMAFAQIMKGIHLSQDGAAAAPAARHP